MIMKGMAKPKVVDFLRARRLVKYLIKHKRMAINFLYQGIPRGIIVPVDSGWAGDPEDRKSVVCVLVCVGAHEVDSTAVKMQLQVLSTGEGEYVAMVSGAARGIFIQNVHKFLKVIMNLTVRSDSSAARGIAGREGVGRIRHMDVRLLWLQSHVK